MSENDPLRTLAFGARLSPLATGSLLWREEKDREIAVKSDNATISHRLPRHRLVTLNALALLPACAKRLRNMPGWTLACLAASAVLQIAPATAVAAELTVESRTGFVIDATINGKPVRLRVDPENSDYIILNPDAAARLGLKPSLLRAQTRVGPVRITGRSKGGTVTVSGKTFQKRLVWSDRTVTGGADGVVGPASLPFDVVRFRLGATSPDEQVYSIPMQFDGLGLYVPYQLGDAVLRFQFSTIKPKTLATASAAAVLGQHFGAEWQGGIGSSHIEYEVYRPTRHMKLNSPVPVGGLTVRDLLVRTLDNRGNYELPPESDADPHEIVVTGAALKKQRAVLEVTVGMDRLSKCSLITYLRQPRALALSCAPPGR